MLSHDTPVIIAARRTPIATVGGRLKHLSADELASAVVGAVMAEATGLLAGRAQVADVVLGNCMGPGGNTARLAALGAGLPVEVPGITIDRQCGSGLSAILLAADGVVAARRDENPGDAATSDCDAPPPEDVRIRIAGGVESASTAPTRSVSGVPYSRAAFAPNGYPDPDMVAAAQSLAATLGIDRIRQDAYAARSHARAVEAASAGRFAAELVAVLPRETTTLPESIGTATSLSALVDDGPRPRMTTLLPRFPALLPTDVETPATLTAGNSCRVSDGAAAVALIQNRDRGAIPGLALIAQSTVGCDPALPGFGPVPAVRAVLATAGISLEQIAAFEIIEAFAGQTLAVLDALELSGPVTDPAIDTIRSIDDRVCADGGALALGHPWGASGAIAVVRLFSRLVRAGAPVGSLGIATAAIGGGMGVAALFEVV